MLLLNPGPVNLSPGVRHAQLGPDLCHREPEFAELQTRVRRATLAVYGLDPSGWASVVLTGSGTSAVEAMLTTLASDTAPVLVIENGIYGERMSSILQTYRLPHLSLRCPWGRAIDVAALDRMLAAHPDIDKVAVVHHETTTGRLNDLQAIGNVCRRHGVELLVDAVSSFGAEAIDFDGWNVAACAVSSNKCLHGVPGTSFVIVRHSELAAGAIARSVTLDLRGHDREQRSGGTLFTPAVQGLYALDAALRELTDAGGWATRHDRYATLAHRVRRGLARLGIPPLLPADASSCALTAYHLPAGVSYATIHDELKRHGFVIYAGQAALASRIFRISTMGAITPADIDRLLDATDLVLGAARRDAAKPLCGQAPND